MRVRPRVPEREYGGITQLRYDLTVIIDYRDYRCGEALLWRTWLQHENGLAGPTFPFINLFLLHRFLLLFPLPSDLPFLIKRSTTHFLFLWGCECPWAAVTVYFSLARLLVCLSNMLHKITIEERLRALPLMLKVRGLEPDLGRIY
ncbi:hypothetical protein EVAR_40776_1 [Eumeta japonica]|uniref:Uncharacterized protein n=1 Tax=Eumeta variegata TaxID=151549 RepID=A0A4C1X6N0_EUMVA|nr:hypothetical protein EVAR_40776_1 [Eumeta japonica]